jgi:hypothetical protein
MFPPNCAITSMFELGAMIGFLLVSMPAAWLLSMLVRWHARG